MKRVIKTTGILLALLSLLFVSVKPALAGNAACDDEGIDFCDLEEITLPRLTEPPISTTPANIIYNTLLIVYPAAGIALLIYLILGGYQFMTSRGEPATTAAAKAKITNAIIGIVIVFVSFWVVQFIALFLDLEKIQVIFRDVPPAG